MKHLKNFLKTSEYTIFKDSKDYIKPNVSYISETNEIIYDPILTFTVISNNGPEQVYLYESGMTWQDFVQSKYNKTQEGPYGDWYDTFSIWNDTIKRYYAWSMYGGIEERLENVKPSDKITSSVYYTV